MATQRAWKPPSFFDASLRRLAGLEKQLWRGDLYRAPLHQGLALPVLLAPKAMFIE